MDSKFGFEISGRDDVLAISDCRTISCRREASLEPHQRMDHRLRVLDDDHVAGFRDEDQFGAGDASAKGVRIGWRDDPVALAPDQHGPCADAVEPLVETAVGTRSPPAVIIRSPNSGSWNKHRDLGAKPVDAQKNLRTLRWRKMDSNHRSRREGGPRPTIVVSRDDLCLMTPVQLIGPAGNSRETLFAKSGTDGSKSGFLQRRVLCEPDFLSSGSAFRATVQLPTRGALMTAS
jgi:hypothetical protein